MGLQGGECAEDTDERIWIDRLPRDPKDLSHTSLSLRGKGLIPKLDIPLWPLVTRGRSLTQSGLIREKEFPRRLDMTELWIWKRSSPAHHPGLHVRSQTGPQQAWVYTDLWTRDLRDTIFEEIPSLSRALEGSREGSDELGLDHTPVRLCGQQDWLLLCGQNRVKCPVLRLVGSWAKTETWGPPKSLGLKGTIKDRGWGVVIPYGGIGDTEKWAFTVHGKTLMGTSLKETLSSLKRRSRQSWMRLAWVIMWIGERSYRWFLNTLNFKYFHHTFPVGLVLDKTVNSDTLHLGALSLFSAVLLSFPFYPLSTKTHMHPKLSGPDVLHLSNDMKHLPLSPFQNGLHYALNSKDLQENWWLIWTNLSIICYQTRH